MGNTNIQMIQLTDDFMKKTYANQKVVEMICSMYNAKHLATKGHIYYFASTKKSVPNLNVETWDVMNLQTGKYEETDLYFNLLVKLDL